MNKPSNTGKNSRSLTFEITPQLFWSIFTAIIGATFFIAFNFGKQTCPPATIAPPVPVPEDPQNFYRRVMDSLNCKVTLLDTSLDSGRVSQLRTALNEYKFIKTDRFAIDDSLSYDIKLKPDVLVAHWHAYKTDGVDAHHEPSENKLLSVVQQYADANPDITVIIFSRTFNDRYERERCTSKKINNLKNPVSVFPLHPGNENEITNIVAKVLSSPLDRIQNKIQ